MECHPLWHFLLASYIVYLSIISISNIVICMHMSYRNLRQHYSSNMLPTYVATKHTTNELLFDAYVNNKLLNGMPTVVAFYCQVAT